MTEAEGCALLLSLFTEAGFRIAENVAFDERGVRVNLDGWDAERRVGYEYITDEAHDRDEFTPGAIAALEARMESGQLFVFLVDEHDAVTRRELETAARAFLERIREVAPTAKRRVATKRKPAKKPAAKKPAAKKPAKKKPAKKKAKRPTTTKAPTKKKPAKKKPKPAKRATAKKRGGRR